MSQHSSLKSDSVGVRHRNVLKRHERIRTLQENDGLGERKSAFRLPKLKLIKLKVKKTKSPKEGEEQGEGQPQTVQAAPQAAQATAKSAAKPVAEKPKAKEKS